MVRAFCLAMIMVAASSLWSTSSAYQAGFARVTASGQASAAIWYPTDSPEVPWRAGPFEIAASQGAAMAQGRFPVVLLSHGRQGGPLTHRGLSAYLAREGFIVIAPTHLGDAAGAPLAAPAQSLRMRPGQVLAALDATLQDARFASHMDVNRLTMIGYSAGGYTALVLAGAKPNFALAEAYCQAEGREDEGSCGALRGAAQEWNTWQPQPEPRLKALILLDPLAVMFDAESLSAVKLPVLLFQPENDALMRSQPNALALAKNLTGPVERAVTPGRHFTFVDPCPQPLVAEAPLICRDELGVDREAVHRGIRTRVRDFLAKF